MFFIHVYISESVRQRTHLEVSGHLTIGGMGNCSSAMVKHLDRIDRHLHFFIQTDLKFYRGFDFFV